MIKPNHVNFRCSLNITIYRNKQNMHGDQTYQNHSICSNSLRTW